MSSQSAIRSDDSVRTPRSSWCPGWRQIMLAGLWFGIVCGLLEGVSQLLVQSLVDSRYVSVQILWVAPVLYGFVFALAGALAGLLVGRFAPVTASTLALLLFIFLIMLDQASIWLQGHVAIYAILVLAIGLTVVVWRSLARKLAALYAFFRRTAPWLAVTVIALALLIPFLVQQREMRATGALQPARADAPNVILIVVDTLREDHTTAAGYARNTTPYLDTLAQQGIRFERAYATSPWSLPSHISLLTGNTYDRHGIGWYDKRGLNGYEGDVLPELLQLHGYRTGAFSANMFWVTHDRMGRGFLHFDDYFYNVEDAVLRTMYGRVVEKYVLQRLGYEDIPARRNAADINAAYRQWVASDSERPVFALLNYMDAHDPYLPPEPYRTQFSPSAQASGVINWRVGRDAPELDASQLAAEVAAYDGGVRYVDEQIRLLVEDLDLLNPASNTLLVITSDHGESFGEHGLLLHGHSLYHEQLHVPLLMVWPGHIRAGQVADYPVTNASIAATILDLSHIEETLQDAAPSLAGGMQPPQAESWPVFAHVEQMPWAPENSPAHNGDVSTIIRDDWQLIMHDVDTSQLFNLAEDPSQLNNLFGQPQLQALQVELVGQLNDSRQLLQPAADR